MSHLRSVMYQRSIIDTKKGGGMNGQGGGQGGPGIPDPISSLQNLASQGSRNNQMSMGMAGPQGGPMGGPQQMPQITASNLLQTLNRGPAQGMGNLQAAMQTRPPMGIGPNGGPMSNQMSQQLAGQMQGLQGKIYYIYNPCYR